MLSKTFYQNENKYLHPIIQNYLSRYNYKGNISLDYKKRVRIDKDIIPFEISKHIIFKYNCTFQQNNSLISDKIRKYVLNTIKEYKLILCIGMNHLFIQ